MSDDSRSSSQIQECHSSISIVSTIHSLYLASISPVYAYTTRLIFTSEVFSCEMKSAKVSLVFGAPLSWKSLGQYILRFLTKLIESLLQSSITFALINARHCPLLNFCFGSLTQKVACLQTIYIISQVCLNVCLLDASSDFPKPFETINHSVLLNKVNAYEFEVITVFLLVGYMHVRTKAASIDKKLSAQTFSTLEYHQVHVFVHWCSSYTLTSPALKVPSYEMTAFVFRKGSN